jgi:hypothetical protein
LSKKDIFASMGDFANDCKSAPEAGPAKKRSNSNLQAVASTSAAVVIPSLTLKAVCTCKVVTAFYGSPDVVT